MPMASHKYNLTMSSRDDQSNQWECWIALLVLPLSILGSHRMFLFSQPVRVNVCLQVIHTKKRQITRQRQRLAHYQTHQQRAGKTWAIGGSNSINISPTAVGLIYSRFDYWN